MQIWIDTADIGAIESAQALGILSGITTNPSLLVRANKPIKKLLYELLALQTNWLAVQVTADTTTEMLMQAQQLRDISERIIIKVPATPQGYAVMATLTATAVPVMATAIYTARQLLIAATLRVPYAAPYLRRMSEQMGDYLPELITMLTILKAQQYTTQIIGAAVPDVNVALKCAELGVPAITLAPNVLMELIHIDAATQKSLERFAGDWGARDRELYRI